MADTGQTPELALRYLGELSTDIRAAVILDADGRVAASTESGAAAGERMAELVARLFEAAGEGVAQVEVATPAGAVFALRAERWTIAAVASRVALPALMFYDLRSVAADLGAKAA